MDTVLSVCLVSKYFRYFDSFRYGYSDLGGEQEGLLQESDKGSRCAGQNGRNPVPSCKGKINQYLLVVVLLLLRYYTVKM